MVRGRPDDTWCVWGGGLCWGVKKKDCSAEQKVMKNSFVQQTVKSKKFVHKTGGEWDYMGGGCLFLCLRGKKKVCFSLRAKKKVCTGEKTIAPTYHLVRPLCYICSEQT